MALLCFGYAIRKSDPLRDNVMFFRLAQEQAPLLYANPWYP